MRADRTPKTPEKHDYQLIDQQIDSINLLIQVSNVVNYSLKKKILGSPLTNRGELRPWCTNGGLICPLCTFPAEPNQLFVLSYEIDVNQLVPSSCWFRLT